MNDRENVLLEKSMSFAVRIVNLCKFLRQQMHETVLSSQVLRSGTSIGANAHEANSAQSKADFVSKCSIALKECDETGYWLELLKRTDYLSGYVVNDDTEVGIGNKIPLWLFGFLY